MDLERIQELLGLMETHGLAEIELEDKGFKVRLRKEQPAAPAAAPAVQSSAPAAASAGPAAGETGAAGNEGDYHTISSPIVGTFYRAQLPEAEPFVEVGDPVDADVVVCIVEAMKVMNEVKAEVPGTVEKVLVENGRPVEYGQPLFLLARS